MLPENAVVINTPPGQVKMSEVLGEFIGLDALRGESEENVKKIVLLGALVWNAAMVSIPERQKTLDELLASLPPEQREDARIGFERQIDRKLQYFGDIHRFILDVQVIMTPKGANLQVLSPLELPAP